MARLLYQILFTVFLFACKGNKRSSVRFIHIDTLTIPKDSSTNYFPLPSHSNNDNQTNKRSSDSFAYGWYSSMLYALHEPVLKEYAGENEIYRFTWLRTFEHPITIRLQRGGDSIQLCSKMSGGAGGYEPGNIIWDTSFTISKEMWNGFTALSEKVDFWRMLTDVYSGGDDGAEWILEGVKNKEYHWVNRWSPPKSNDFRNACEYLINLSHVATVSKHFY